VLRDLVHHPATQKKPLLVSSYVCTNELFAIGERCYVVLFSQVHDAGDIYGKLSLAYFVHFPFHVAVLLGALTFALLPFGYKGGA
jgi:hypothetical protein